MHGIVRPATFLVTQFACCRVRFLHPVLGGTGSRSISRIVRRAGLSRSTRLIITADGCQLILRKRGESVSTPFGDRCGSQLSCRSAACAFRSGRKDQPFETADRHEQQTPSKSFQFDRIKRNGSECPQFLPVGHARPLRAVPGEVSGASEVTGQSAL